MPARTHPRLRGGGGGGGATRAGGQGAVDGRSRRNAGGRCAVAERTLVRTQQRALAAAASGGDNTTPPTAPSSAPPLLCVPVLSTDEKMSCMSSITASFRSSTSSSGPTCPVSKRGGGGGDMDGLSLSMYIRTVRKESACACAVTRGLPTVGSRGEHACACRATQRRASWATRCGERATLPPRLPRTTYSCVPATADSRLCAAILTPMAARSSLWCTYCPFTRISCTHRAGRERTGHMSAIGHRGGASPGSKHIAPPGSGGCSACRWALARPSCCPPPAAPLTRRGCGVSSARMVVTIGPPSPHTTIWSPSRSMPGTSRRGQRAKTRQRRAACVCQQQQKQQRQQCRQQWIHCMGCASLAYRPVPPHPPTHPPLTSTTSMVVPSPSICFTSSTVLCRRWVGRRHVGGRSRWEKPGGQAGEACKQHSGLNSACPSPPVRRRLQLTSPGHPHPLLPSSTLRGTHLQVHTRAAPAEAR